MRAITFDYKNWKGEVETRRVLPLKLYYGSTDYHKGEQWILQAFDLDKMATRDFAMSDIKTPWRGL